MTACFPSITTVLNDGPGEVRQVLRGDGSSFKVSVRNRRGYDLTLSAPMSMSLAFELANAKGRKRILAAFDALVNEAVGEVKTILCNQEMPIGLQTHDDGRDDRTHLHTHCLLRSADVPDPRPLFEWVDERRRALKA